MRRCGGDHSRVDHAEIAGAGFAGLVAAIALRQRGWSVRVHEQSPELRAFGAGILSSKGETIYAIDSDLPNRIRFDLKRVALLYDTLRSEALSPAASRDLIVKVVQQWT